MEVPLDRLQLRENDRLISPPIVEPLYRCSKIVQVRGFIAEARLDVEVNGFIVVNDFPAGFPEPNGALVPLPKALDTGQQVRARQHVGGVTSDWSTPPQTVRDHRVDFPAGPPRPVISPAPVFKCGSRTGVDNLLNDSTVWITASGTEVGRVEGAEPHQAVNVKPDYDLPQDVVAFSKFCGDPSPPSKVENTKAFSGPLPAPTFETPQEGSRQVVLNGLANGARFTLKRSGLDLGTHPTWGGRTIVHLPTPIVAGESFEANQTLCPGDGESPAGITTSRPCSEMPAPEVGPIQDGDTQVTLLSFVPDARIKVFVNLDKIGDGSGPVVALTQAIHHGDVVHVLQIVGTCIGRTVQELRSVCVAPPAGPNPAWLNLFPVGFSSYDGGPVTIRSNSTQISGTVYYPAESDGSNAPFNLRLAALGPVPIVFMVHGRHPTSPPTPSYLGYNYFQSNLAQMGMIAVSVNCVDTDHWGGGADNIHDRAELVIRSMAHFQTLNSGSDPIFAGRIDFTRVGLMGHSRGGEAVVTVPEIITLAGVTVRAVLSLAPTNKGASSGSPHGYPDFLTILPAYDADVVDNNGAQFYDGAHPGEFRCQLYVENANHNYFNRQWGDDTGGGLPLIPRDAHERILSAYGCALFRHALLGHNTVDVLNRRVLPAGVDNVRVQVSFAFASGPTNVDHFEDENGIATNSLGGPNAQIGGMAANEFAFSQIGASFNGTFYGATQGMVAMGKEAAGTFRLELARPLALAGREIWVRAAEVYNGNVILPVTGFELGVESTSATVSWVDSNDVGGLSPPQDRRDFDLDRGDKTKTMLKTLRFPVSCFGETARQEVIALRIRLNRREPRPIAFDDIQIV
jgi:dienelactone hydrolase